MSKKKNVKILKFPTNVGLHERQIEAILFSAEEPLSVEDIQERVKARVNIPKILESLQQQYQNRGINLVLIAKKWSFRTSSNLSKFMALQTFSKKKLSKAALET